MGLFKNALSLSAKHVKQCTADYLQNMNSSLLETRLQGQLLPDLPSGCVIVMDNAKYHSRRYDSQPSTNTRKNKIVAYMQKHNILQPEGWKADVLLRCAIFVHDI